MDFIAELKLSGGRLAIWGVGKEYDAVIGEEPEETRHPDGGVGDKFENYPEGPPPDKQFAFEALQKKVAGAIKSTLTAHGPIDITNVSSAAKRIAAQLVKGD